MKIEVRFDLLSVLQALAELEAENVREAQVKSYNFNGNIVLSKDDSQYLFTFVNASGYIDEVKKIGSIKLLFEELNFYTDSENGIDF